MTHPALKIVTLLTVTSLLVACQPKATVPTSKTSSQQPPQTSTSPTPSTSSTSTTTRPASPTSTPSSSTDSASAPSQASSSAMAQNQNTSSPQPEASQVAPQVTESTTLVSLPENSSDSDSRRDGNEASFEDKVSPDGPITRPIVTMPQDLIGSWNYEDDYYQTTVTITADGAITSDIQAKHGGDFHYAGQMGLLIQESENLYRLQGGNGEGLTPVVGLGGLGKTALGVELINANLISIRLWGVPLSENMETYTYTTTNSSNVWFLVRRQ